MLLAAAEPITPISPLIAAHRRSPNSFPSASGRYAFLIFFRLPAAPSETEPREKMVFSRATAVSPTPSLGTLNASHVVRPPRRRRPHAPRSGKGKGGRGKKTGKSTSRSAKVGCGIR